MASAGAAAGLRDFLDIFPLPEETIVRELEFELRGALHLSPSCDLFVVQRTREPLSFADNRLLGVRGTVAVVVLQVGGKTEKRTDVNEDRSFWVFYRNSPTAEGVWKAVNKLRVPEDTQYVTVMIAPSFVEHMRAVAARKRREMRERREDPSAF